MYEKSVITTFKEEDGGMIYYYSPISENKLGFGTKTTWEDCTGRHYGKSPLLNH